MTSMTLEITVTSNVILLSTTLTTVLTFLVHAAYVIPTSSLVAPR